jgi:hypothetical protein
MLTPAMVHYGQADSVLASRQSVMAAAYAAHPERFVRGEPQVRHLPDAVWINPPARPNPSSAENVPQDRHNHYNAETLNPGVTQIATLSDNQLDRPESAPSGFEALP